ncbi:hypothetical protein FS837_005866 [Tulasnella sp. UAMH 9824]|nr:hypothetical protein FS837_005866 [Tulasnella sp. UAMH 9824]
MNSAAQNLPNAPVFEVPDPIDEFGQDGGKFYRCYDALADEIDEDMVKGLKEQLDGMLIFAGIFAGVNSAFLAITLPLLSADPSDDITALLAQNNAILIQMVTGRNDSIPTTSRLPSAEFSPSRDVLAVNALFSLSLAFAIMSSFLAVLGRQWLVYYRKKSGGGPDRQRWVQLKRFLGAERWQLEPILDDVLPSLLQLGLIIFCASLILYLRHLSPTISFIVGIPMYVGLAFFVGSALCAIWDRFCPFQSPLSHVMIWSARTIPSAVKTIQVLRWEQLSRGFSIKRWVETLSKGREEESPGSLQVIALRRAICTSDDPATLLNATANIFSIKDVARMEELWTDPSFRERFNEQLRSSYSRMLQLRGRDQTNIARAAQRLYAAASVHIILYRNTRMSLPSLARWLRPFRGKSFLIPDLQIPECSTCLLRSTLTLTVLQACVEKPSLETFTGFCNYVFACSLNWERQDWRLFCVLSLITSNLPDWQNISRDSVREAYRGFVKLLLDCLRRPG